VPRTREIPVPIFFEGVVADAPHPPPTTPTEALMSAPTHAEPEESSLEKHVRLDALKDALEGDVLSEIQLWVVEAHVYRGLGFRVIAAELGRKKTYIHKVWKQALARLESHLIEQGEAP
jgi:DNA-directed RNA polymerase specialized sigma24 family protein